MVDFDLGEFFLNFFLPYTVRPYAGIDLQPLAKHLGSLGPSKDVSYAWNRLLFGLKPSPYNSIRFYYHAEEYVAGNPREPGNPLRWDRVVLNLPGASNFDPRLPWVYQWDDERKTIAGSVVTFVDDGRGSGSSVEHAWQVLHRCATRFQHLGIQVAIRKVRPPAPGVTPGAWAGMIAEVNSEGVFKTVAQGKWDKARDIVNRLLQELHAPEGIPFKPLERDRGFLVHMAATFKAMNPYLKGIHLMLDSWRANRRSDGWKMKPKEWAEFLEHILDEDVRAQLADLGVETNYLTIVSGFGGRSLHISSCRQQKSDERCCLGNGRNRPQASEAASHMGDDGAWAKDIWPQPSEPDGTDVQAGKA
eukprot:scaffold3994_cov133-Cylindrotheca_fusiformis.AAC.1